MLDAFLHAVRTSDPFIWCCVVPALFNEASPLTIVLVSPYVDWGDPFLADRGSLITLWATAASAVPYTEEICRSVVDALLHISGTSFLRSHVPVGIWRWLEKQPSLLLCAADEQWEVMEVLFAMSEHFGTSRFSSLSYSLSGRSGIPLGLARFPKHAP